MATKKQKIEFNNLRKKFPEFVYDSYKWSFLNNDFKIIFKFSAGKHKFTALIKIKNIPKSSRKIKKEIIDNFVFNLGIIESFSYWKLFCSPIIKISAGGLNKDQILWWEKILSKGMGQYFFENKINFKTKDFIKIISNPTPEKLSFFHATKEDLILPIGGGKDSLTSLYLLEKQNANLSCFFLNPTKPALAVNEIVDSKNNIICERKIDPYLLELNRKGYLNGHTPFLAYLSFLTATVAMLYNKKYIVLSNEKSSNEGNTTYLKEEINHQYSKTFDFENRFREYIKKYLSPNLEYFSLLRPLYEIQIAKIFSEQKEFLPIFLSCNEAEKTYSGTKVKTGQWCGACAKCLFVYMVLYPFVPTSELKNIFGGDLFTKKELLPLMLELIGQEKIKPWECVGTKQEANIALYLSWKKNVIRDIEQPFLLEYFAENIVPKTQGLEKQAQKIMQNWDIKNNIPKKFNYRKQVKL
jgi:UDP-N-acetyl-alpha-D-muramoyl-L-alanyl-L-glutamate epimerase